MLTRHFYDIHSVEETLFLVAGNYKDPLRKQKLVFWTYELLLSEEWERMWGVLERISNRYGNTATSAALQATQNSTDVLHFLQTFLSLPLLTPYDVPKDTHGAGGAPDRPAAWTVGQRIRLQNAVSNAIVHRRTQRIARLLGGLPPATAALYLGIPHDGKGILHMLETLELPALPTRSMNVAWPTLPVGRLAARLFSVPRSLLPSAPLDPSGAEIEHGCAFWRRMWKEGDAVWNHFLDDIPDEWPASERSKSHP